MASSMGSTETSSSSFDGRAAMACVTSLTGKSQHQISHKVVKCCGPEPATETYSVGRVGSFYEWTPSLRAIRAAFYQQHRPPRIAH